jgi:hypothetical protein
MMFTIDTTKPSSSTIADNFRFMYSSYFHLWINGIMLMRWFAFPWGVHLPPSMVQDMKLFLRGKVGTTMCHKRCSCSARCARREGAASCLYALLWLARYIFQIFFFSAVCKPMRVGIFFLHKYRFTYVESHLYILSITNSQSNLCIDFHSLFFLPVCDYSFLLLY